MTLFANVSVDSSEAAPSVVLDFDADDQLVGIEIGHASQVVDLSRVDTHALPVQQRLGEPTVADSPA